MHQSISAARCSASRMKGVSCVLLRTTGEAAFRTLCVRSCISMTALNGFINFLVIATSRDSNGGGGGGVSTDLEEAEPPYCAFHHTSRPIHATTASLDSNINQLSTLLYICFSKYLTRVRYYTKYSYVGYRAPLPQKKTTKITAKLPIRSNFSALGMTSPSSHVKLARPETVYNNES